VVAFTPGQLSAGAVQTPQLTLRSAVFNLVEGLRFDARGDLFVASNDALNVARFARERIALPAFAEVRTLGPDGSLEADADDRREGRTVRKPGGIAFDRDGNLFVNSQRGASGTNVSAITVFAASLVRELAQPQARAATVLLSRSTSNPGFGGLALELP
jgi:hypothetical protein